MTSIFDEKIKAQNSVDKTHEILERAMNVGFKWNSMDGVFEKIYEELDEVKEAIAVGNADDVRSEVGDLLFAVIKLAAYSGFKANDALEMCNDKFLERFMFMEKYMAKNFEGDLNDRSVEEMMQGWNKAKDINNL